MKLPALARIPILLLVVAGCTTGSGASSTPGPVSTPSASPAAAPTPRVTAAATPALEPTATPVSVETFQLPPAGALGAGDAADVGWLGSYCWQGTCADVAEIPDAESLPLVAVSETELIFSVEDGGFVSWVAAYGPDGDSLSLLDEGGATFDPDIATPSPDDLLSFAEFEGPPAGDWIVTVQVFFPEGDATYGWHVVVE